MILRPEHFYGRLTKIAQYITELESGSKSSSSSSSKSNDSYGSSNSYFKPKRDFKVRTFSQYRDRADLQPLHKDTQKIKNPPDKVTLNKMNNKQDHLSNIRDNRMLFDHLRNK